MQTFKPAIRWWSLVNPGLIAHYSETLEVRDDRFVFEKGILDKSEIVVPFSKITDFSIQQSFFDRIFGIANFTIETAGSIAPELVLKGYPSKLREVLSTMVRV